MNSQLRRMAFIVCAVVATMLPETASAQVSWTEIQLPAGTRSDLRWPVYPLHGDGLLLIHYWSDSLFYTSDSGTTWEAYAISEEERTYPGLPDIQRCPVPYVTGNWKGLRCFDVGNARVVPEAGRAQHRVAAPTSGHHWRRADSKGTHRGGKRIYILSNTRCYLSRILPTFYVLRTDQAPVPSAASAVRHRTTSRQERANQQ